MPAELRAARVPVAAPGAASRRRSGPTHPPAVRRCARGVSPALAAIGAANAPRNAITTCRLSPIATSAVAATAPSLTAASRQRDELVDVVPARTPGGRSRSEDGRVEQSGDCDRVRTGERAHVVAGPDRALRSDDETSNSSAGRSVDSASPATPPSEASRNPAPSGAAPTASAAADNTASVNVSAAASSAVASAFVTSIGVAA